MLRTLSFRGLSNTLNHVYDIYIYIFIYYIYIYIDINMHIYVCVCVCAYVIAKYLPLKRTQGFGDIFDQSVSEPAARSLAELCSGDDFG